MSGISAQFCADYARQRAAEGRDYDDETLKALPYLTAGPLARQWQVRARSFDAFVNRILAPAARPLAVLDLGAGNGWLCHRAARMGHKAVALDMREDEIDGLGAARRLLKDAPQLFACIAGFFEELPLESGRFDVTVFNASLHYARDLPRVLEEAARVTRPGGTLAILDTPFYRREADGAAMVAEKQRAGAARFGAGAEVLLGQNFIEYLTPERLSAAMPRLTWTRHPVRYPLWYEMRPLLARLKGARTPSRFDLWTAAAP